MTCAQSLGGLLHHLSQGVLAPTHTLSRLCVSRKGSTKRQSKVGRPGSSALKTEPSGRTSCLRMSKSCLPGLSDTYTAAPLTALAAACTAAAGCLLQWHTHSEGIYVLQCIARLPACTQQQQLRAWLGAFCAIMTTHMVESVSVP